MENEQNPKNLLMNMLIQSGENIDKLITALEKIHIIKTFETISYYESKKIFLTETDSKNQLVIAHEFGHCLLDQIYTDTLNEQFQVIKEQAQKSYEKSYINSDSIHSISRTLKNRTSFLIQEEKNSLEKKLANLYDGTNLDELYALLKTAIFQKIKLQGSNTIETTFLDQMALSFLNTYSKEQIINFLKETIGNFIIMQNVRLQLDQFEKTKGLTLLSDLLLSLHDGKYYYYELVFLHRPSYYAKNPRYSLEEQFANYVGLKLGQCSNAIIALENILGKSYIAFMESLYQNSLQAFKDLAQQR